MIERIQHIGYLVAALDETVAWFEKTFGGKKVGGDPLGIGRNAIFRFGQVEVDLIEPADSGNLPKDALTMHHVGYIVPDILKKFEGRVLARGGRFQILEGPDTFERNIVVEFPALEQAVACHASPEYQEARKYRLGGVGQNELVIVEAGDPTK